MAAVSCATAGCNRARPSAASSSPSAAGAPATASCAAPGKRSGVVALDKTGAGSTVALAQHEGQTLAFIADADEHAIHVVDIDSGKTQSTTTLDSEPAQLMLLADGRLAVAMRELSQLRLFDTSDPSQALTSRCAVNTATEPVALAVTPDRKTIVVSSDWGQALGAYDSDTLKHRFDVPLPRSAAGVVVDDASKRAFVTHAAGAKISAVDLATRKVEEISLRSRDDDQVEEFVANARAHGLSARQAEERRKDMLKSFEEDARTSCQGFAITKTAQPQGRVLAPHVMVDAGREDQRTAGYGEEHVTTELPGVAVVDATRAQTLSQSLRVPDQWRIRGNRGELTESCILPRSAAVDDATQTLLVGCLGIDAVVAYDAASATPGQAEIHRWRVASGPTGIAMDAAHRRAVVWSQFDRTLNTLDLADLDPTKLAVQDKRVAQIEVATNPERTLSIAERLGRRLFHATQDTRIARDGRACASCHPAGRDDGLVWSTPDGPRRSIMLAGRVQGSAPYGWGGAAVDLERHLDDTFKRLGGVGGLRSVELDALVEYIGTLAPPPTPPGSTDPVVRRGAEIFAAAETGCAKCHTGEAMTDAKIHDVGSRNGPDRTGKFETPSLRYLSARGPYFHDGRYGDLRELLVATSGKMGKTSHLAPKDLDALEAYLKTL